MDEWFDTFFEEKGLDLHEAFEFEDSNGWNYMPYGTVVEAIKSTTDSEKAAIQHWFRKIDYANGDWKDYLRHLGKGLA